MPRTEPVDWVTVKIPRAMVNTIDRFLQTETSKQMGCASRTDVIIRALSEMFEKYSLYGTPAAERLAKVYESYSEDLKRLGIYSLEDFMGDLITSYVRHLEEAKQKVEAK